MGMGRRMGRKEMTKIRRMGRIKIRKRRRTKTRERKWLLCFWYLTCLTSLVWTRADTESVEDEDVEFFLNKNKFRS
jgi:hypothetical protein